MKKNIYDLAGNVCEWTLEKAADSSNPCAKRGGFFYYSGSNYPASIRSNNGTATADYARGFRCALY